MLASTSEYNAERRSFENAVVDYEIVQSSLAAFHAHIATLQGSVQQATGRWKILFSKIFQSEIMKIFQLEN